MSFYTFHELLLEVHADGEASSASLTQLLLDLSWRRLQTATQHPALSLVVHHHDRGGTLPRTAREVFSAEGLQGFEGAEAFYLTAGASLLSLQPTQGRGEAHLAPTFVAQPHTLQQRFWSVGLLKLLRPLGLYALHAAGMVTPHGQGLLIVGPSGSGKSTLALGLVRQGWGYLSDDAVLLRGQSHAVEALALRKPFSIEARVAGAYADLPLGAAHCAPSEGRKRRVCVAEAYPAQHIARCCPQLLLFAQVVPDQCSSLCVLDRVPELQGLLAQSGPPLFDRRTMAPHLAVLSRLVHQTRIYTLRAGRDLYQQPGLLGPLLAAIEGETPWRAS
jgi:hypothetical protein